MSLPKLDSRFKILDSRFYKTGFSLIELLVVISIIGILVTFATVSLTNAQQKGRDSRRKADLKTIQQALELYFQANGKYPALGDWSFMRQACPTVPWSWNACETDPTIDLRAALLPYINNLPVDPVNADVNGPTNLGYLYEGLDFTYSLYARLENTNDPDINCPGGCGWMNYSNYKVQNP